MSKQVTENKSKEYGAKRDAFRDIKKRLVNQIREHKTIIGRLEEEIKKARPKTENGSMLCKRCDCVSMKYDGRTPQGGLSGGYDVYICEICGYCNLNNYY